MLYEPYDFAELNAFQGTAPAAPKTATTKAPATGAAATGSNGIADGAVKITADAKTGKFSIEKGKNADPKTVEALENAIGGLNKSSKGASATEPALKEV